MTIRDAVPHTGALAALIANAHTYRFLELDLGPLADLHLYGVNLLGTDYHLAAHAPGCQYGRHCSTGITTSTLDAYLRVFLPGHIGLCCPGFHHDPLTPEQEAHAASLPILLATLAPA